VAASVLAEFAKEGHQLLIFTCHEHVWRMFQQIKVDSRRLPNRFQEDDTADLDSAPEAEFDDAVVEPFVKPVEVPPPAPKLVEITADPLDELNQSLQEEELSEEDEPEEKPVEEESSEAEFNPADEDSEPAEEPPSPAAVEVEYSWSE